MATALKNCWHSIPLALTFLSGPRLASGGTVAATNHQSRITNHWPASVVAPLRYAFPDFFV